MAVTTLSAETLTLFRRFAAKGREASQGQISLISVWKKTFETDEITVVRSVALVQSALARLVGDVPSRVEIRSAGITG